MGRITSNVGLITGIPIKDTVDQLIAVEARPRDLLVNRNKQIQAEQVAIKDLTARLLSLEFSAKKLSNESIYKQASVSSSDPQALTATLTGDPPIGNHQFTSLQVAQSHQLLSSAFADADSALAAGTLTFGFGGFVDPNTELDELNGGQGIVRGKIRITDRGGATAEIDLRYVRTVGDVLKTINDNTAVNVTAQADGDRIRLLDNTGETGNLKVQEVAQGTTAASLGLAGIDVAADQAIGGDVVRLFDGLALLRLNGGNGVRFNDALPDLRIAFRNGSTPLEIDFNELHSGPGQVNERLRTLGDVLAKINAADPTRLKAEIGPDGDRIVLTDLTTDSGGSFEITDINGSRALEDLGLDVDSAGAVATGRRVLAGLRTTLLSDLGGSAGLRSLGLLSLTDRSGAQATVDLSTAETLQDVLDAINGAGLSITANVNQARNGIDLLDTSGATAGNLIVADGDAGTQTASRLGLLADQASSTVHSGALKRRVVSENTRLASLNGGAGVAKGSFTIFDTKGSGVTLNITDKHQTIGDVIKAINNLGLKLDARVNDAGDGIALVDTGGGTNKIRVLKGGSTSAADLHLLGESTQVLVAGQLTQVLSGSTTAKVTLDGTESLTDLVTKINALNAGVTATTTNDGSATNPLRLILSSQRSGEVGELLVDASQAGFTFAENIASQDARLLSGSINSAAAGIVATSSTNEFKDVLTGVTLSIQSPSATPVTVSVANTDTNLVSTIQAVVDTYNGLRAKLGEYTKFDTTTNVGGPLLGDTAVQRVQNDLASLLSSRVFGAGSIQSLERLGVHLNADGTLSFNSVEFRSSFTSNRAAVGDFFSTKDRGFVARLQAIIEQAAGSDRALLVNRDLAVERKIALNQEKINFLNARLDRSRERWLLKFYNLELAIGKIKNNLSAISQIQAIPPLGSAG